MIVTITGAYRNCGDHLIGHRAKALLQRFVDKDIVNIDRKKIKSQHYDVFNDARFVFLCGGPAYQKHMYPSIYPLELDKIKTKVIPFGLGYKAPLNTKDFQFSEGSKGFINALHKDIPSSSARDIETVEVLNRIGIENVTMTGCPAWYDMDITANEFSPLSGVKSLVVSAPARVTDKFITLLKDIARQFPSADLKVALHHGYLPGFHPYHLVFFSEHLKLARISRNLGYSVVNLAGDLKGMLNLYKSVDLHLGFRVHAHILRMSQRLPSILISEDRRGTSQSKSLKCPIISGKSDELGSKVLREIEHIASDPNYYSETSIEMRDRFGVMKSFLENLSR